MENNPKTILPERGGTERLQALDGLRGYAAIVVLICHCLLTVPSLSAAYGMGSEDVVGGSYWMTYSPLHLFWAGTEAVYVFFILSGFVLASGPVRGIRPAWRSYYLKRLIRLYLPVWAAIVVAVGSYFLVSHRADPHWSGWMQVHDSALSFQNFVRDFTLMVQPGAFVTPLWSLKWEVVFSVLLPLFLIGVAPLARRCWPLTLAALLSTIALGETTDQFWLTYLPMFGVGVLLAATHEKMSARSARLSHASWVLMALLSVSMLTAGWTAGPYAERAEPLFRCIEVCGAALLVILFTHNRTAIRLGTLRPVQWIGIRSFSLYLIHEPIVVTTAILLPPNSLWLVLLLAIPLSLIASAVFFMVIEAPSHRLAQTVGRLARAKPRRTMVLLPSAASDEV